MPSSQDCATLQAIYEGVQAAQASAEQTWGADRLPIIVGDEMREKLRRQQARWSATLQAAWDADMLTQAMLEDVRAAAGGMQRAWQKLAESATEAGHRPVAPWVWEVRLADGTVAALVQTADEAAKVIAEGRHVVVYTAREIANVIDALPDAIGLAKATFPGAKVQPQKHTRPDWYVHGNDPVPF